MASSEQLKAERSRYYVFREQVNTLATKILDSINKYKSTYDNISATYQVNDECGDAGVLKRNYEDTKNSYYVLINQTLPSINSKIDSLGSQIRAAEKKEEEEEKKEEERLKAEAQRMLNERV